VQQALAELKAKDAALAGNKAEAERFRAQADAYAKQATSLNESYQSQRQSLDVSNKQALEALNAANHARDDAVQKLTAVQKERDAYKSQLQPMQLERDDALQRLTAVQKERDSYKSQLEAAQQQLREFQKGSKAMSGPSRKSSGGSEPSPP